MTYKSQVNQSTNQPINQLTVIPYVSIYNWFMQKPIHLTCEHLSNPLGLDEIQPRLSWQFAANAGLKKQTAYQIIGRTHYGIYHFAEYKILKLIYKLTLNNWLIHVINEI